MISASASTVQSFTIVCGPTSSQTEVMIAVGLFDAAGDRLFMRFRPDLHEVIAEEEIDFIGATEGHFLTLVAEYGATKTIEWMHDTLSNFVRFEASGPVERTTDFEAALDDLYERKLILKTGAASL